MRARELAAQKQKASVLRSHAFHVWYVQRREEYPQPQNYYFSL